MQFLLATRVLCVEVHIIVMFQVHVMVQQLEVHPIVEVLKGVFRTRLVNLCLICYHNTELHVCQKEVFHQLLIYWKCLLMYIYPFQLVGIAILLLDGLNLLLTNLYLVRCYTDITIEHIRMTIMLKMSTLITVNIKCLIYHNAKTLVFYLIQ